MELDEVPDGSVAGMHAPNSSLLAGQLGGHNPTTLFIF